MNIGRVARFWPDKGYGFLVVEGVPQDVFIHLQDGREWEREDGVVRFSSRHVSLNPAPNEQIRCLMEREDAKRLRARPWGFVHEYEEGLSGRDPRMRYRVVEEIRWTAMPEPDVNILWEGPLDELRATHQRHGDPRSDNLTRPVETQDFRRTVFFERCSELGWLACRDPRPVEYVPTVGVAGTDGSVSQVRRKAAHEPHKKSA